MGTGSGTVDRAVGSDTRGPQFESVHCEFYPEQNGVSEQSKLMYLVNEKVEKEGIKFFICTHIWYRSDLFVCQLLNRWSDLCYWVMSYNFRKHLMC